MQDKMLALLVKQDDKPENDRIVIGTELLDRLLVKYTKQVWNVSDPVADGIEIDLENETWDLNIFGITGTYEIFDLIA